MTPPRIASQPTQSEHPFAPFIRILGKGKTGTRSLTQEEARQAFGMILRGETEPLQLGAFLMLLRVKEETPEELAGFVQACREIMLSPPAALTADLDWSSYAGKHHQHPWYILSMLLLAGAGYRVLAHGSAGHTPGRLYTELALAQLGIPVATGWKDVMQQLASTGLSYLPLESFCAPLQLLMQLRPLLGLRSPVNTLCRLLNPLRAPASLQSIFHPAYARLHQQADLLLGQPRALVFKGESGEVEIKPHADTRLCLLQEGKLEECVLPRALSGRMDPVSSPSVEPLRELWLGLSDEEYGLRATLETTAVALMALDGTLGLASAAQRARQLWESRDTARLA
ncbi:MAG: glycosyl transferase family protein [Halioglobus sp.]